MACSIRNEPKRVKCKSNTHCYVSLFNSPLQYVGVMDRYGWVVHSAPSHAASVLYTVHHNIQLSCCLTFILPLHLSFCPNNCFTLRLIMVRAELFCPHHHCRQHHQYNTIVEFFNLFAADSLDWTEKKTSAPKAHLSMEDVNHCQAISSSPPPPLASAPSTLIAQAFEK